METFTRLWNVSQGLPTRLYAAPSPRDFVPAAPGAKIVDCRSARRDGQRP